jgi:hypothetical protein
LLAAEEVQVVKILDTVFMQQQQQQHQQQQHHKLVLPSPKSLSSSSSSLTDFSAAAAAIAAAAAPPRAAPVAAPTAAAPIEVSKDFETGNNFEANELEGSAEDEDSEDGEEASGLLHVLLVRFETLTAHAIRTTTTADNDEVESSSSSIEGVLAVTGILAKIAHSASASSLHPSFHPKPTKIGGMSTGDGDGNGGDDEGMLLNSPSLLFEALFGDRNSSSDDSNGGDTAGATNSSSSSSSRRRQYLTMVEVLSCVWGKVREKIRLMFDSRRKLATVHKAMFNSDNSGSSNMRGESGEREGTSSSSTSSSTTTSSSCRGGGGGGSGGGGGVSPSEWRLLELSVLLDEFLKELFAILHVRVS